MTSINLPRIRETAEKYYADGDFYCSESIVKTIMEEFGLPQMDEAIKMASGFPVGIGGRGCACGAISGGVMAIGLFFGRSQGKAPAVAKAMELSGKLHDIFIGKKRQACCRVLTKGMALGSDEHMSQCIFFTGDVAYETAKLIATELGLEMIG